MSLAVATELEGAAAAGRSIVWRGLDALAQTLAAERERWALWLPVAFGLGILIYFRQPAEPRLLTALLLPVMAGALAAVLRRGTLAIVATSLLLAIAAGFAVAKLRSDRVAAPVLERQLVNVEVEGFVELVEPRPERGQRVTIDVTRLGVLDASRRPARVRIRLMSKAVGLAPGVAVRLKATLAPPAAPALPGDYDYGRAAWFHRIGAVGYALQPPSILTDAGPVPLRLQVLAAVERVRQDLTRRIVEGLPGETGWIAAALITGERGGIGEATNEAYRASGLFHILSISGLHMVVMAGAVFWTVRLVLAAMPGLALRYPVKKWAAVAACLAAFAYLLISGAQPATQRSYVMISVGFLAVLADRPAIALRTVAVSALALLVIWPESLLDIGFQMSFAAVVALVAAFEEIRLRRPEPDRDPTIGARLAFFLGGILLTTLIAGVAVAPFSAYYFHNSQQYAMVANLLAIPVCNLIVMPAALATLLAMPLGLEALPLAVMGVGIDLMTTCAKAVAAVPGSIVRFRAMPEASFALMVAGGLWLCLWRTRWRLLGVAALALGLALAPFKPPADLIVGREGRLVAVRGADGRLSAMRSAAASFELRRWLENDGDPRTARQAFEGSAFRCDAIGCTAMVGGRRIAIVLHPLALGDDCREAFVVIVRTPAPAGCAPAAALIDLWALREHGTHVVRIGGDRVHIETADAGRGDRPWRNPTQRRRPAETRGSPLGATAIARLRAFSPPFVLGEPDDDLPRPEVEDDATD